MTVICDFNCRWRETRLQITIIMLQSGEWDDAAAINYNEIVEKQLFFGYIDIQLLFLQDSRN